MTLESKKKKAYGPYKGSKANGGRSIIIEYDPKTQKTTSKNGPRYMKEKSLGRKLKKDEHVDHHDNNRNNDSASNLKVMKASDNIAKGNRNRKKKKK
jgi:hypothetical protein